MNVPVIAVDFDGTCVEHAYPDIGDDVGAVPVLRALSNKGYRIILWTMRDGKELEAAQAWFAENGIPLYGANHHPDQHWTGSPKVHADLYIDDKGINVPLKYPEECFLGAPTTRRPFVDWETVRFLLEQSGWLKPGDK